MVSARIEIDHRAVRELIRRLNLNYPVQVRAMEYDDGSGLDPITSAKSGDWASWRAYHDGECQHIISLDLTRHASPVYTSAAILHELTHVTQVDAIFAAGGAIAVAEWNRDYMRQYRELVNPAVAALEDESYARDQTFAFHWNDPVNAAYWRISYEAEAQIPMFLGRHLMLAHLAEAC